MKQINDGEENTKKLIETIEDITDISHIEPRDGEKIISVFQGAGYLYCLRDGIVRFRDLNTYWKDLIEKRENMEAFYETIRPEGK